MNWKDSTRRDGSPESSSLETDELRIVVHHYVGYPPDQWLLTVYGTRIERRALVCKDLDAAKEEALDYVVGFLRDQIGALCAFRGVI